MARLVRDVASGRGWAIAPDSSRHMHEKAVPRLGGIAILGSVVLVVTMAAIASNLLHLGYSLGGKAAMAERYAYVPLIGSFVMISWGLADLAEQKKSALFGA
jgi:UDP-N-acetylmuramyl pentapeptide phosphotransferase/UDP-N-acetylglucosamine-1-phosphate transferase